jgi:hypothetical protein
MTILSNLSYPGNVDGKNISNMEANRTRADATSNSHLIITSKRFVIVPPQLTPKEKKYISCSNIRLKNIRQTTADYICDAWLNNFIGIFIGRVFI